MNTPNVYADGTNTIYEPVIESLRSFLESNPIIGKSRGGAIIFFTKKENGNLKVRVFPLKKDSALFEEAKDALAAWQIDKILEQINTEKHYHLFSHHESFKQDNMSMNHFTTRVPDTSVVNYDKEYVEYNGQKFTWKEFYKEFESGKVDKNTYEQLLFEPGCNEISYIPLPVLSTPFILLVLNNTDDVKANLHELLRVLYFRSRDTVSKYLYSRLIDNLLAFLSRDGYEVSEEELVKKFVLELCNILLPASYSINDGKEEVYYDDWPTGDKAPEYALNLLDGNQDAARSYRIVFKLTSFVYTDLIDVESEKWTKFHESVLFKANIKQSSILIAKLFNLLFQYWYSLKMAEDAARKKVAETLAKVNISGMMNGLIESAQKVKKELNDVEIEINRSGSGPMNQLTIVPSTEEDKFDEVTLVVSGTKLIEPRDIGGKNQVTGFKYLRYILEAAKKTDYKCSIVVYELLDDSYGLRISHPDTIIRTKMQKSDFKIRSADLIEAVRSFVDISIEIIDDCLRKKNRSANNRFNEGFYHYAAIHNKLKSIPGYLAKNAMNGRLDILSKLYVKLDEERGSEETKKGIDKATAILDKEKILRGGKGGNNPEDSIAHLRTCFRAMLEKIREEGKRPEKEKAANLLLKNLSEAGLFKENKSEPKNRNVYTYNQKNIQPFIDWEL